MSAYVESFVPPHRQRSIPLDHQSWVNGFGLGSMGAVSRRRRDRRGRARYFGRGMSDLGCACGMAVSPSDLEGIPLEVTGMGDDQPGLFASALAAITGKGSVAERLGKAAVAGTIRGGKFRSNFTPDVSITPNDLFAGGDTVEPTQSTYSIMGVVKPGFELDTVGGTVKIYPWGEPGENYGLWVIGGTVLLFVVGAVVVKKVF